MDDPHFHVWIRRGRIFSMTPRRWRTRQGAHHAGARLTADPASRMVLRCEGCPPSSRSKRPAVWPMVAARLGVDLGDLRAAIREARGGVVKGEMLRPAAAAG